MNTNLPKVKMRLVGLDGNAFSIMGAFQSEARKQGWDKESITEVLNRAMSGDYNHLLRTIVEVTEDCSEDNDEFWDDEEYD